MMACLLPQPFARAQQYLATLSGEVADTSGAKVAKAEVVATEEVTHFVTKSVTSGSGVFTIPSLAPGTYDLTIEIPGFKKETRTGIVLTAGANVQADFALQVGSQQDQVVVTTDTALLDTASANLGDTLASKEVSDLPNVGRNPFVLATLIAGVTTGAYMQSKASGFTNPFSGVAVQISSNGNAGHNRLTLNGIPDDPAERLSGAGYTGFVPSPEAVQEVKVQTALFDAQYGHGNGTVTNTVIKNGTNALHGAVYTVFQNTYLNANTWERVPNQNGAINPAAPTHRTNDQLNQSGGVFSGPVWIPKVYDGRDKTFFMVAFERYASHVATPFSARVPTDAEKGGDFSGLCTNFVAGVCAAGAGQQIYDPTTVDANGNRTPFLNNQIPASRFNAAGAALIKYFPEPNTSNGINNYVATNSTTPSTYPSFIVRVDQAFGASNKLNAIFFKSGLTQSYPLEGFPLGIGPANSSTGFGYSVYRRNIGGSLDDVQVISPTLVVDARVGVLYHPFGLVYPGNTFNLSSININGTGLPYQSFPGINMTDSYSYLAAGAGGQISENTTGSMAVIVTKTLSRHSLRFGFEGNLIRYNVQNPQSGFGAFAFNRMFTQKNSTSVAVGADANSGDPMAALLLGYPSSGSYGNQVAYALQQIYAAPFAQDDWRVGSKLTVNLGVRWDYESPFTERHNQLDAAFCTTCASPLQVPGISNLTGGLQFVSSSNRSPYAKDWNNFQPRIGAAYQLSPSIVLRGGYGIIYFNTLESPIGQGFSASTSYVASLDSTHPANAISNPFPAGVNLPTGSSLGLSTQLGQSVNSNDPNHVQPYAQQFSVSTQTQLPAGIVLQIAYIENRPSKLEVNRNIDALPIQYLNQGAAGITYLQTQVANPFAGKLPGSSLNGATVQRQFLLTPYPQFTSVTSSYASIGSARYDALQTTVSKRLSHGLTVHGNFTWQKTLLTNSFLNPQDTKLFRYQDPQATLVGNLIVTQQLPRLSARPAYERLTLGGWQVNGVLRAQNGSLVANPGGVISLGGSQLGNPTYAKFFNTCYLNTAGVPVVGANACASTTSTPAFQQLLSFSTVQIAPYSAVRQRIHPLLDVSMFKQFQIHERYNFEIRGEFFNVLNTPNFGGPGTSLGSTTFGTVTQTQANDPRIGQLTARINF